jgi:SAM-dependent methyltransferase
MNSITEIIKQRTGLFRDCPVCGGKDGIPLGRLGYELFEDAILPGSYDVACCGNCGFVVCNTPASQADYDEFYKNDFYSPAYLERALDDKEKRYFKETAEIFRRVTDSHAAIFDIGCGAGYLLETLRNEGFKDLYGVDPSGDCVKLLNERKHLQAAEGSLTSIPFKDVNIDLIILSHLLEHILDINPALKSIAGRIPENGRIYIEVPDSTRYGQFAPQKPLSFFYFQHVIHFDLRHLTNLLRMNGFSEEESGFREREEKGFTMPCLWGVFKKTAASGNGYRPDFSLALQIHDWFRNTSLDPDGELRDAAGSGTPVYVWGMGIHAQMMLKMSPLRECNIAAFVDKNPRLSGKKIFGKSISSTGVFSRLTSDDVVMITALIHRDQMTRFLREEMKFKGRIITI